MKTVDVEDNQMAADYFAKLNFVYHETTNVKIELNDILSKVKRAENDDGMFEEFKVNFLEKLSKFTKESLSLD